MIARRLLNTPLLNVIAAFTRAVLRKALANRKLYVVAEPMLA